MVLFPTTAKFLQITETYVISLLRTTSSEKPKCGIFKALVIAFTIAFLYPVMGSVLSSRTGCTMGGGVGAGITGARGAVVVVGVSLDKGDGVCTVGEGTVSKIKQKNEGCSKRL